MQAQLTQIVNDFECGRISRRQLITQLMVAGAAIAGAQGFAHAGQSVPAPASSPLSTDPPVATPTFKATALNHIALAVTDVARSRKFYETHLGMTLRRDGGEQTCFLSCGKNWIALFKAKEPRMHHYCYSISDYTAGSAVARLEAAGLKPKRRSNRVYFDDADGLEVQVSAP